MGEKTLGVVIGGSGLIGGTIVNYYKKHFPDTVDIRAPSSKKLSIRIEDDIVGYLHDTRPRFLINAAMANLASDGQLAYEINYLGSINLARAALALGIPYIHLSSAATLPSGEELSEEDTLPLGPGLSNYAKSKLMAEITLARMAAEQGLDYSCIRLAIVYGAHDHKIQGFHRLFFTIADESMPALFTRKKTYHSYSNSRKLPYLIDHMLNNRAEFRGQTYHFVDREPVDLATLIMTIRSYLNLRQPREIYVPLWLAGGGKRAVDLVINVLRRFGLKATMPPELMFLESFYTPQTLSGAKLRATSFVDPLPEETIFTRLPELLVYYLNRWSHENLITTFKDCSDRDNQLEATFHANPQQLVDQLQHHTHLGPIARLSAATALNGRR